MRKIKLHTKFILLLTGVSLVPLIAVSSVALLRFQQTLRADAAALGQQIAATAAAEIESFVISQLSVLDNIAAIYDPEFPVEADVAERVLENVLFRSVNFSDISVVSADGIEIVRKNRLLVLGEDDLRDVSTSDAYNAVRTAGLYVGPVYVQSGRPFFDFGREIRNSSGEFAGAVFAQVDARVMPTVVDDLSRIVRPSGRVYIVNAQGVVIAHPDLSYMLAERDQSEIPVVGRIVADPDALDVFATYENELRERVLGSAYPMTIELPGAAENKTPDISWFVIVEQPEDAVFSDARNAAWFLIAISFAAVLFAIGSAVYFAGRVSRPIVALHTAAKEFGKGNLAYRAKVTTGDEIGELAASFNSTAEALAKTVTSLRNEENVTIAERNKLRLILSGITNAVVAVDLDQRVILFNDAAETLTGRSTESVIGKPIHDVVELYSGQEDLGVEKYCPPVDTGPAEGVVFNGNNLRFLDARGAEHFVNLVTGRIRGGERINLGCILTFHDVTRDYLMERTKREFVSIAAHQLRTPLTGMSWASEALLSGVKGALSSAQKELVEKSIDAVHRMVDLVNDLLNVSRIEEGRFGVKRHLQSLYPIFSRVLEVFQKEAKRKHINFSTGVDKGLPELFVDGNKLEFALSNLLDNALKYTRTGGTVSLKAVQQGDKVVISISDSGIGIAKEEFDRVFSKFFRSKDAISYLTDGSGLGLYVVKNIVDQHGGSVWFDSEKGKGTTFYIALDANVPG